MTRGTDGFDGVGDRLRTNGQMIDRAQLEQLHCWENDDHVPGRPAMTDFRRRVRLEQAIWREANGHPIGSQPIVPHRSRPARKLGSRLPLDDAQRTGANFVSAGALDAARERTGRIEPHQSFDHQRLWADLLSSAALAFNLFGELAADPTVADHCLHVWLPNAPGRVREVRFAYSPGRLDPNYLNSLRAFDTAFIVDLDDGTSGIIAVGVKYREANKPETPRPENLHRYREVATRAKVFHPDAVDVLTERSDLCVMWLEHLLVHAMLQHPSHAWTWGAYVVVHHPDNVDVVDACSRYQHMLTDDDTFAATDVEHLLASGALPETTVTAVRSRYRLTAQPER